LVLFDDKTGNYVQIYQDLQIISFAQANDSRHKS